MLTRASSKTTVWVRLPFLALSRRNGEGPVPAESPDSSGHAIAFTTLVDAGSYLQSDQSPEFELELIFRQSLANYVDAVERAGLTGVSFDARSEQATTTTLAELRAMLVS